MAVGRFRPRWATEPSAVVRCPLLLRLARLQEASRIRPPRLGQPRPRRDAAQHPHAAPRLLGRGHPRSRLRLGGDGTGDGGVQQAPGRQEGERAGQAHGGRRVPPRRPPPGRRFRRRPRADRRGGDETTASGLDDVTTYYILHRHDFGLGDAPVGACILYAVSCNLSDTDLTNRHEILLRTGGLAAAAAEDDEEPDDEERRARRRRRARGRHRQHRQATSLEPAQTEDDGLRRRRPPRAADRPGPPPDAPLEARRRGQGR